MYMNQYNNYVSMIAEIAKIVADHHAELIVVTSPAHHRFRCQTNAKNIELMNSTMDSLASIYPIRYKNYLLDTVFYHEELFTDIHHLNRKGASTFTQMIKKDFNL